MEFLCDTNYILLPASDNAQNKRLYFYIDNELVYDLVVRLDNNTPDYKFPVDLKRFKGKKIKITSSPIVDICFDKAEEISFEYDGKYRPLVHFTAAKGWINDPNGLVYANGKYLMYFQHNPVATTWENMHWGSAFSEDLIHWREFGDVLFPDKDGTMFSGCAIIDKDNRCGFQQDDTPVILYYYTSAGHTSETSKHKPFTQCLAYSTDGGKTLIKYDKNPIIENLAYENRDPKVIYYSPLDIYIMVLFLDGHSFAILKSENLTQWQKIQEITMPDDSECPDFYPLTVENDSDNIKWVFSAAADRYYIGSFDGKKFKIETKQKRLNFGNASYAAQSWFNTPDGRRIRTAFASAVIPNNSFGSCLNIPQNMTIKKIHNNMYLSALPIDELKTLYKDSVTINNVAISNSNPYIKRIDSRACDISISADVSNSFSLELFGLKITYGSNSKTLFCLDKSAPLKCCGHNLNLRVIFDTVYAEIFADDGTVFMGMTYIQDSNLNRLEINSEKATIHNISISELNSIHEKI